MSSCLPSILTVPEAELQAFFRDNGEKSFRRKQLQEWLYRRHTLQFAAMTDLPGALRLALTERFADCSSTLAATLPAPDGTEKLLLHLADGEAIEMVLIPSPGRMTFCLSTQVGCPVGCRFCASGRDGLIRNLHTHEILEQLYHGSARIGRLPDNIVFMGIGEGLLNLKQLLPAITMLIAPERFGMAPRRLTVSTSGYVPGIYELAAFGRELNLAVSLHAVDDATRAVLIPDTLRYPLAEILAAVDDYQQKIGRMATFEYTLIEAVNDQDSAARALARLARRHHAKINLIPYNATTELFRRPSNAVIRRFAELLEAEGAKMTLRLEKGAKVAAACGQLRATHRRTPAATE